MRENFGKLSFGLIVIFLGMIILLQNLDVLSFSWSSVLSYWPLVLILIGINLMLPHNLWGRTVSICVTLLFLGYFTYIGLRLPGRSVFFDTENSQEVIVNKKESTYFTEFIPEVKVADLKISGGAINFKLGGKTEKLAEVHTQGTEDGYSFSSTVRKEQASLVFKQKKEVSIKGNDIVGRDLAVFSLNPAPVWNLEMELGAGTADLDLSAFKVKHIEVKGGVSAIALKLGNPVLETTRIDYEGGVSSLTISIPRAAGCKIKAESAFSSMDFPGFNKQEKGEFLSEGYAEATHFFEINLKNGLSSIRVNRY